jgi:PHD/YefM family antitoxin component YafN of YafNO toxin-antitoxin module
MPSTTDPGSASHRRVVVVNRREPFAGYLVGESRLDQLGRTQMHVTVIRNQHTEERIAVSTVVIASKLVKLALL